MLTRNLTLDQRIKDSQLFPRIRDAEKEIKDNEYNFFEKVRIKKDKVRRRKEGLLITHQNNVVQQQYFSSHVLNKDPAASKYLPYDEVYFPKLFDETTKNIEPEGIDTLWILALKDLELRRPIKAKAKEARAKKKLVADAQAAFRSRRFNMYES